MYTGLNGGTMAVNSLISACLGNMHCSFLQYVGHIRHDLLPANVLQANPQLWNQQRMSLVIYTFLHKNAAIRTRKWQKQKQETTTNTRTVTHYTTCTLHGNTSAKTRDVKVLRPLFGLGLTIIGFGLSLGLVKYWSRSHTLFSRGLKSILCSSSVMTSDCVPCSVNLVIMNILLVGNRYHHDYSLFIISNI